MKSFLSMVVILSLGLFCYSSHAAAQGFNGFELNNTVDHAAQVCVSTGGKWNPFVPGMAECSFPRQIISERSDGSYDLSRSKTVSIVFGPKGNITAALFGFNFSTWSKRDHAMKSLAKHMNELFPLTVTKTEAYSYKLNNLNFLVDLLTMDFDKDEDKVKNYHLVVSFSLSEPAKKSSVSQTTNPLFLLSEQPGFKTVNVPTQTGIPSSPTSFGMFSW